MCRPAVTHAIFGATQSCSMSQNVYLRNGSRSQSLRRDPHKISPMLGVGREGEGVVSGVTHSRSSCFGLMILRRYVGSKDMACCRDRLLPTPLTVVGSMLP